jgi:hypothetical protein
VVDTVERKERTGVSLLSAVCCPLISNNHTPPPDPSGCETEASALAATLAERGKSTAAMFERVRVCRGGGAGAREEKKREEVGPEPNNESEKSQVEEDERVVLSRRRAVEGCQESTGRARRS